MKTLLNVIWLITGGIWLSLSHFLFGLIACVFIITIPMGIAATHVTTAVAQALTIVGIPLAIANIKMIPITCFPFGKEIVDSRSVPPGSVPPIPI
ncbi:hypothetical protein CGZ93_05315 [Enemella dayhoffiae]|uniref:Inner membrane component domain-containing protein n=1 Tax=Enemella dayhoffiae TaxID=2016507 RepID=A0A255HAB5_9ACTN|nr:YccF domain-containing protein [Enemella dayhoffiae]OYO23933.1 hypothetical protein CGZ93_05315 [Enemella dayhoffiae]